MADKHVSFVLVNNSDESLTEGQSGAIATHLLETARIASMTGSWPAIITRQPVDLRLKGISIIQLPKPPRATTARRLIKRLTGGRNLSQQDFLIRVVQQLRKFPEVPVVTHNDPELAATISRMWPKRVVLSLLHNEIPLSGWWAQYVATSHAKQAAVSGWLAERTRELWGYSKLPVSIIHNGVDLDIFRPSASRHASPAQKIAFLGRTGKEKGLDLLLEAAILLRAEGFDFEVHIIGSNRWGARILDEYQKQLDELVLTLWRAGITVECYGHVARRDLPKILASLDCLVVPSRWPEPFALALLEGMASGLVPVLSRSGGMPEVANGTGILFDVNDVHALREALKDVITGEEMHTQMRQAARLRAEELPWEKSWLALRENLGI